MFIFVLICLVLACCPISLFEITCFGPQKAPTIPIIFSSPKTLPPLRAASPCSSLVRRGKTRSPCCRCSPGGSCCSCWPGARQTSWEDTHRKCIVRSIYWSLVQSLYSQLTYGNSLQENTNADCWYLGVDLEGQSYSHPLPSWPGGLMAVMVQVLKTQEFGISDLNRLFSEPRELYFGGIFFLASEKHGVNKVKNHTKPLWNTLILTKRKPLLFLSMQSDSHLWLLNEENAIMALLLHVTSLAQPWALNFAQPNAAPRACW